MEKEYTISTDGRPLCDTCALFRGPYLERLCRYATVGNLWRYRCAGYEPKAKKEVDRPLDK